MAKPALSPEAIAAKLVSFIAECEGIPPGDVRVEGLQPMAGGASRELWSLNATLPQRSLELVLRRDPPGRSDESDRGLEFELLRAARAVRVPVPEVHWCCRDARVLGSPFFLMERVAGETIPRRLLRDPEYAKTRENLVSQMGAILARIHTLDWRDPALSGLAVPPEGTEPARTEVMRLAEAARTFAAEPHPVLDLAERWLLERIPATRRRTLVHGDYRVGNVIFDTEGVCAILDWELAHVGDPVEDLGWFCVRAWRFGNDDRAAGGVGDREQWLNAYGEAGGDPVDREALRFWEALGNFKVALVFIQQAHTFLSGRVPSLELASLGRRTAEAEAELLHLMEEGS